MKRTLRVFVYRNLNNGHFSIRQVGGRVIAHTKQVLLHNCVFKVSEPGRQRVLRTKQKVVHAGVEGDLVIEPGTRTSHLQLRVSYNPFRGKCFRACTGKTVRTAPAALLRDGAVFIQDRW